MLEHDTLEPFLIRPASLIYIVSIKLVLSVLEEKLGIVHKHCLPLTIVLSCVLASVYCLASAVTLFSDEMFVWLALCFGGGVGHKSCSL